MLKDAGLFKERRARLRAMITDCSALDTFVLCAAAEPAHGRFRQDSTFYYFTGMQEPGAVLCMEGDGAEWLFVPSYNGVRAQWAAQEITVDTDPAWYGVTGIRYQGSAVGGYALRPFGQSNYYTDLMQYLLKRAALPGSVYVASGTRWYGSYGEQLLWYLGQHIPHFNEKLVDVSAMVATLRRRKDEYELSSIRTAIERTAVAQRTARSLMIAGHREREIRAAIDATFLQQGSPMEAFPSIVAAGVNATVLHYLDEGAVLRAGDMVVVDIGATAHGYAADITRTYVVGGRCNPRQRELYQIVLDTQAYIASEARPGLFLNNRHDPEHSLHHLAKAYLGRYGLAERMPHSIGHFMGLDVHDVGDPLVPLAPGDVITIEPGSYHPDEKIGIRIEDNYVITASGAECLSEEIAKELHDIEGH